MTNSAGEFSFSGLSSASYEIIVTAKGFARTVQPISNFNSEILLTVEPSIREEVTIVSGSRQEELRESLNTKVDVITESDMRNTGYNTVGEILRELPGVVTRRGSETAGTAGEADSGTRFATGLGFAGWAADSWCQRN